MNLKFFKHQCFYSFASLSSGDTWPRCTSPVLRACSRHPTTGRSNFVTKRFVKGTPGKTGQTQGALRFAHFDARASWQCALAAAIAADPAVRRGILENIDGERGTGTNNQRTGEQGMSRQWHQLQRLHVRPHDRPSCGKRIRSGTGRASIQSRHRSRRSSFPHHPRESTIRPFCHGRARSSVMSFNAQSPIGSFAPGSHTSTCAIMRSSME